MPKSNIRRLAAFAIASLGIIVAGCETVPETRPSGLMTLGAVTTAPRGFIALCRTSFQACPADVVPTSSVQLAQSQGEADHSYWLSRVRGGRDVDGPGSTSPRREGRSQIMVKAEPMLPQRIALTTPRNAWRDANFTKTLALGVPDFQTVQVVAARPFFATSAAPQGLSLLTPGTLSNRIAFRANLSATLGETSDRRARPFFADITQPGPMTWIAQRGATDPVSMDADPTQPAAPSSKFASAPTAQHDRSADPVLSAAQWAQVRRINTHVNAAMQMRTDRETFGSEDVWQAGADVMARYGDCEDYVLQKRHDLLAAGFGGGQLSIALVRTRWGEAHAVLLLNTGEGEYVLDNLSPWVMPWTETDYEWIDRQAPGDAMTWVRIGSPATT